MDSAKAHTTEQSICLTCGICCDGTLFNRAPLKPEDDLTALLAYKNIIIQKETRSGLQLPCAAHQNKCCQIYDQPRPAICGSYRCLLLKKHEKGEVSFAEAEATVNRTLRLREAYKNELARVVPGSEKLSVRETRSLLPDNKEMLADPLLLKKWGSTMMLFSALIDSLQTNFHRRVKKAEKTDETI